MSSIRTIKDQVLQESGATDHFEFIKMSDALHAFWERLNRIGFSSVAGKNPYDEDFPDDVDAATEISKEEAERLLLEFRTILKATVG